MERIIILMLLLLMMMSKFKHTKLFVRFEVHFSLLFCRIDIRRTVHCALFFLTETEDFISESLHEGNLFLKVSMKAIFITLSYMHIVKF